jgi:LysM repeat protein
MSLDGDGKYTVRQGDSLYVIAKRFGIKQEDLCGANGIGNPDMLKVGQKLNIPAKNHEFHQIAEQKIAEQKKSIAIQDGKKSGGASLNSADLYTIKSGDSIGQIAKELGVNERDLLESNNLSKSSPLQAGKKLLIPQRKGGGDRRADAAPSGARNSDFFDSFEEIPVVEVK